MLSGLYSEREAISLTNRILEYRTGVTRVMNALDPERRLYESDLIKISDDIRQLLQNRPIQYILGETQFLHLTLTVNEQVMIPRPETEELVEWIIHQCHALSELTILDIGTGSGCIALALKYRFPSAHVDAMDISSRALEVAQQNASRNGLEINFFQMDILDRSWWESAGSYKVIVSNPPYVTVSEKLQMHPNVLEYEPAEALFVSDDDPLIFYRTIVKFAESHLLPGGYLFFEINEHYGREVVALFNPGVYETVTLRQDIYGKDRFVWGVKRLV